MKGESLGYKYGLGLEYSRKLELYGVINNCTITQGFEHANNRRSIRNDVNGNGLKPDTAYRDEIGWVAFAKDTNIGDHTQMLNMYFYPHKRNLT